MTIDERITEAAEDVRRSLATMAIPPPGDTVEFGPSRPGWQLAAAAAALVLIVAGLPFLIGSFGDDADDVVTGDLQQTTVPVEDPVLPDDPFTMVAVPDTGAFEDSRISSIVETDTGYLAGGIRYLYDVEGEGAVASEPVVWISGDGVTWTPVESPAFDVDDRVAPNDDTYVAAVASGPLGFVAVGTEGRSHSYDYDAAAWFSADGTTWSRVASIENGGGEGVQVMSHVVAGGPGWVAAGLGAGFRGEQAGVWVSSDGLEWTRADFPNSHATVTITDLVASDGVVIAVGQTPGMAATEGEFGGPDPLDYQPLAWRSLDGLTWEEFALPVWSDDTTTAGAVVETVTVLGDGSFLALGKTVTTGETYFDRVHGIAVWSSPTGDEWRFAEATADDITGVRGDWLSDMHEIFNPRLVGDSTRLLVAGVCLVDVPSDWDGPNHPGYQACVLASADRGGTWHRVSTIPNHEAEYDAPGFAFWMRDVHAVLGSDGALRVAASSVWVEQAE